MNVCLILVCCVALVAAQLQNQVEINIQTSSCSKAGTDDNVLVWFGEGFIGDLHFGFTASHIFGPYTADGSESANLERGHHDHLMANNNKSARLTKSSLLIFKKESSGVFSSLSGDWKPERITVTVPSKKGSLRKYFKFPLLCQRGWISGDDYYIIAEDGTFYQLKDSGHLSINVLVSNGFSGEIVCHAEHQSPNDTKPSRCPAP